MYRDDLVTIGLSKEQSEVYELLLKRGEMGASNIATETKLNRTLVYKYLEELETLGLVEKKDKPGKAATFTPLPPENIKEVLTKRRNEVAEAEASYSKIVGRMLSDFNTLKGKPGVQLFQGYDTFAVLDDALFAKSEVKQFIDITGIQKHAAAANRAFSKQRDNRGQRRKLLTIDSRIARERAMLNRSPLIEWRFIKKDFSISTTMFIYDGKVSYTTATANPDEYVGVIIADPSIATLHEALFDYMWETAEPFTP